MNDRWILLVSFAVGAVLFVFVLVFSASMIWQCSLLLDQNRKQIENQQQESLRRSEPGEEPSSMCEPSVPPYSFSPLRRGFSSVLNIDDDTSRGSPFALYLAEAWAVYAVFLSGSEELL